MYVMEDNINMVEIQDGTAKFAVRDKRLNTLLNILYPVGSIKITVTDTEPFKEYGFGTWQEVSKGRVLLGADDSHAAGSTIEAGLPNITGRTQLLMWKDFAVNNGVYTYLEENGTEVSPGGTNGWKSYWVYFNASKSSSIYGNSDTVTPPSYVVHFWQRIS